MSDKSATQISRGADDYRTFRAAVCWIAAVVAILSGLGGLALADGWRNEVVAASIRLIGGILLLPPVLREIRKHLVIARPVYAPVAFFFLVGSVAVAASALLMPSPEERRHLQQAAMARAEGFLEEGKPASAEFALRKFSERRDQDKALDALLTRIDASEQARDSDSAPATARRATEAVNEPLQDPASLYVERIETYWLPEAQALPNSPPEDDEAFGKLLTQIDGLVLIIEDGARLPLSVEQKAARSKLIDALSKKQVTLLPAFRQRYAEELDAQLFRRDIRVSAQGRTLRLVGAPFVKNANIEDMQRALSPVVNRLRFTRVEYRWNLRIGDTVFYELTPPADTVVARWDGGQFVTPVS